MKLGMRTGSVRRGQSGIMLLEALVAILIFSIGILAMVALQAVAIKQSGDANYRTRSTLLANRLIGQMWVTPGDVAAMKANFETGGGCIQHMVSGSYVERWVARCGSR